MKSIVIIIISSIILFFLNDSNGKSLIGDWMTLDSNHEYCELYFSQNKIQIFLEVAGYISPSSYELRNDSLISEMGNFKINWVHADSVHLTGHDLSVIMKRIESGNRLGEYINMKKAFDQNFKDDFWSRMSTWKELPY